MASSTSVHPSALHQFEMRMPSCSKAQSLATCRPGMNWSRWSVSHPVAYSGNRASIIRAEIAPGELPEIRRPFTTLPLSFVCNVSRASRARWRVVDWQSDVTIAFRSRCFNPKLDLKPGLYVGQHTRLCHLRPQA